MIIRLQIPTQNVCDGEVVAGLELAVHHLDLLAGGVEDLAPAVAGTGGI